MLHVNPHRHLRCPQANHATAKDVQLLELNISRIQSELPCHGSSALVQCEVTPAAGVASATLCPIQQSLSQCLHTQAHGGEGPEHPIRNDTGRLCNVDLNLALSPMLTRCLVNWFHLSIAQLSFVGLGIPGSSKCRAQLLQPAQVVSDRSPSPLCYRLHRLFEQEAHGLELGANQTAL